MDDTYKLIFGFAFAILLIGIIFSTIIYFCNTSDCNNKEKEGYIIYSKPTFLSPTCEIMTENDVPIGIHLLDDCPCCIPKMETRRIKMNTKKEMIEALKKAIEITEKLEDTDKVLTTILEYRNDDKSYHISQQVLR